jgi:hypothetical protein
MDPTAETVWLPMKMPHTNRLPRDEEVLEFGRELLGLLLEHGLRGGDEYRVIWQVKNRIDR